MSARTVLIGGRDWFIGQRCTAPRAGGGRLTIACNAKLADYADGTLAGGDVDGGTPITCPRCGARYTLKEG